VLARLPRAQCYAAMHLLLDHPDAPLLRKGHRGGRAPMEV
jgi:hypothetical protein